MQFLRAIIMGIVQGLTEFLPVSSSGHLAILKNIFNVNTDTGLLFDVMLHLGTLLAVCVVYWDDVKQLVIEGVMILLGWGYNAYVFILNLFSKEKRLYRHVITTPYRRFVMLILVSSVPTAILGLLLKDITEQAGNVVLIPGAFLIVTSILLFMFDRLPQGKKTEATASYKDAALVGVVQGIATMPGISRSGSTIFACRAVGFDGDYAVKYSFIMSIPAILGSAVLEMNEARAIAISMSEFFSYVVGMLVAAVVGYICIKTMLLVIKKNKFVYFAYYCLIVGLASCVCYFV
ncbi:MAG: undecaprenyl-diphosphate phosphatase [Lachnospiraceae bacterium]